MEHEVWIDGDEYRLTTRPEARALPKIGAICVLRAAADDVFALEVLRDAAWDDPAPIAALVREVELERLFVVPVPRAWAPPMLVTRTEEKPAPEMERATFEVLVIDDEAEPVDGITIEFVIDGAKTRATTGGDGIARANGRAGAIAKASIADSKAARKKVEPRWAVPHLSVIHPAGIECQYPRGTMPSITLRAEHRRTIALVPAVLVLRLAKREVQNGVVILSSRGTEVAMQARHAREKSDGRIELRFVVGPGAPYELVIENEAGRRTVLKSDGIEDAIEKAEGTPWNASALPTKMKMMFPPPPPRRSRGRTRVRSSVSVCEDRRSHAAV
jgi:hypothetical protein